MKYQACRIFITTALIGCAGCGRDGANPGPPAPTRAAKDPASTSKEFRLKGVVRSVDAASGEVTISHEDIPGFMPKMTMPFTLEDKSLLDDVRAGDEVEGPLRVEFDGDRVREMDLVGLAVTKAAPAVLTLPSEPGPPRAEPLKPGELVPDFEVTTQDGRKLRLSDWEGEVVALTFIYTRCPSPEFCPAMDAKFAELARRIAAVPARAGRVRLLSISFDPEHDTPEVLAAHAARRGARPPLWTFAAASHEELARVAGRFGLTYVAGTREIDHNLRSAVIGPDGRLARLDIGPAWTPAELLKTILDLIPTPRD